MKMRSKIENSACTVRWVYIQQTELCIEIASSRTATTSWPYCHPRWCYYVTNKNNICMYMPAKQWQLGKFEWGICLSRTANLCVVNILRESLETEVCGNKGLTIKSCELGLWIASLRWKFGSVQNTADFPYKSGTILREESSGEEGNGCGQYAFKNVTNKLNSWTAS